MNERDGVQGQLVPELTPEWGEKASSFRAGGMILEEGRASTKAMAGVMVFGERST